MKLCQVHLDWNTTSLVTDIALLKKIIEKRQTPPYLFFSFFISYLFLQKDSLKLLKNTFGARKRNYLIINTSAYIQYNIADIIF